MSVLPARGRSLRRRLEPSTDPGSRAVSGSGSRAGGRSPEAGWAWSGWAARASVGRRTTWPSRSILDVGAAAITCVVPPPPPRRRAVVGDRPPSAFARGRPQRGRVTNPRPPRSACRGRRRRRPDGPSGGRRDSYRSRSGCGRGSRVVRGTPRIPGRSSRPSPAAAPARRRGRRSRFARSSGGGRVRPRRASSLRPGRGRRSVPERGRGSRRRAHRGRRRPRVGPDPRGGRSRAGL